MSGIYYDLDLYAIWKEENYNEVPFAEENFANGAISYVTSSYEKRTEILGLLEKYAVKNHLTGLTLFENGGYVMYHPSVIKGTNEYVPGFGCGVLSDGYLEYDLEGEANPDYKRYYQMQYQIVL